MVIHMVKNMVGIDQDILLHAWELGEYLSVQLC